MHRFASNYFDLSYVDMFNEQYFAQTQIKGFRRAIVSTLRNKTLDGYPKIYEQLGKLNIPILLLWGQNDQTLPLNLSSALLKLIAPEEFHIIEECGHIPQYEKPGTVNPIIINFIKQK